MARGHSRHGESLRGIHRNEGARPLATIQEGFEQLAHGHQGIGIKQGAHPLPQQALAPELQPDRSKPGTTQLLRLVHHKRQHHQHGTHHRQMLLAMPLVGLTVIALVFQRVEGLICDLPPGSPTPHEVQDIPFGHPQVGDPADVLDLVLVHLPVCDKMDPHLYVRRIEGDVIEKTKPMHQPCGAVVPFIRGNAPSVLRGLALLEQIGMIAFFHPEDRVEIVILQGLNVRGIGTHTVFGDKELQVGMILAQLGKEAFGGIPFAIILGRPITVDNRLRHARNDGPLVRMDDRSAQHRVRRGDGPVAGHPVSTGGTVHRLGRKILGAIHGHKRMAIQERQRFKRLAALQLPKDARADRAEPRGGDGIKSLAHVCVARDTLDPVDGVHMALGALLVKGEERGRFEGKHGEGGHEDIWERNIHVGRAIIRDVVKAGVHQPKERIGREMLACFGSHIGHGNPCHEKIKTFTSGGIFASRFTKGQCS